MSKSKRLLELMMTVNRKRKFTVKELARDFNVSPRTILRDLQELGELGVPLYSEVGPHGGYQVLKESILPPIAFSEREAAAIFFACHALRHYTYLPFELEAASALAKFYNSMSGDIRDRIDQMKNRVDFVIPARHAESPYLSMLLDAAVHQKVILIEYESGGAKSQREIQPVGIYANSGLWYCPAYCFMRRSIRLFRCDRISSVKDEPVVSNPVDLRQIHLMNRKSAPFKSQSEEKIYLYAELSKAGSQTCEAELWTETMLRIRPDGSGWLEGYVDKQDLPFYARFLLGLGNEAEVTGSPELLNLIKSILSELSAKYNLRTESLF